MNKIQQRRYESLYEQHVNALKRQGKSESTIDVAYRDVSKGREQERKLLCACRQTDNGLF